MLCRFHNDQALVGDRDAKPSESVRRIELLAHIVHDDVDPGDADPDASTASVGLARQSRLLVFLRQPADFTHEVQRTARGWTNLPSQTQGERGADACLEAELDRHRVEDHTNRGITHTAVEKALKQEGRVSRRAGAHIVRQIGHHDWPDALSQSGVDRHIHVDGARCVASRRADIPGLLCQRFRQAATEIGSAIGVDQNPGPRLGYVGVGKAMVEADRKHAAVFLVRDHPVDEVAYRGDQGPPEGVHGDIVKRGDRLDCPLPHPMHQSVEMLCLFRAIGMRIALHEDQQIGAFHHLIAEISVGIQHGAKEHLRTDNRTYSRQQVALAVVAMLGGHRAMQIKQDCIDRQRLAKEGDEFSTQTVIGVTRQRAARRGGGGKPFDADVSISLRPIAPKPHQIGIVDRTVPTSAQIRRER